MGKLSNMHGRRNLKSGKSFGPYREKWKIIWTLLRDICDVYAPCGDYGICDTNSSVLCKCSQGFETVSSRKWESSNWSDGCQRRVELKCGDEVGFLQLRRSNFPYLVQFVEGSGPDVKLRAVSIACALLMLRLMKVDACFGTMTC
ncbi:hypothetical protein Sjap_004110 [Stephania japonica]|uniref:S-locus glycoprotein domain-containing protein n=1 Tax=Stephania japonica TaxID=461633 RepID=A0AAP0K1P4_9MAGN